MGLVRIHQDSITHFGILGQKWGVRRWQYPDGRFTEEGKERYFGKNADKEGYLKRNKDGTYDLTEKGFKNIAKFIDKSKGYISNWSNKIVKRNSELVEIGYTYYNNHLDNSNLNTTRMEEILNNMLNENFSIDARHINNLLHRRDQIMQN